MKICFVTDGGRQLGMGHVQQSTALGKALRGKAKVSFLTKSDDTVVTAIEAHGFAVTRLRDDAEILDHLKDLDPDIVVFDKIDVAEDLARAIKQTLKASLVIFTNLTGANKHADIAVTAGVGSQLKNVTYTDKATNTRYYFGPKYWVLRPEFYEYKSKGKIFSREPEQILLLFGGSDPSNLTSAVLEELLGMNRKFRIEVILGAQFHHDGFLNQVLEQYPGKRASVAVHRNIKNVAELMYRADLTIASPGLTVFETLCVGTPVIIVPHNDFQRDAFQGLVRMLERDEIGKLGSVIEGAEFTYPRESHITAMEIGEGVQELLEAILSSVKS